MMRWALGVVVLLGMIALTICATTVLERRARDAAGRAERAEQAATRSARAAGWAGELAASCEAQARADLDAAHARIRALESSLRAIAATSPCRVRLPRPIEDAPRPLWCEDRTSWWSEPLPTLGALCYGPEARDPGWLGR